MKRIFFISVILSGLTMNSFAQHEHRFSVGPGLYSKGYISKKSQQTDRQDRSTQSTTNQATSKQYRTTTRVKSELIYAPINFNLHYEYKLNNRCGIGACLGFEHQKISFINEVKAFYIKNNYHYYEDSNHPGTSNKYIFNVLPEATFYYLKKDYISIYGKLAAGVGLSLKKTKYSEKKITSQRGTKAEFAFQASPACIEVGGKNMRGFAELGYGSEGIGQVGIKYTIGREKAEES